MLTLDSGMPLGDAMFVTSGGVWGISLADLFLDPVRAPRFWRINGQFMLDEEGLRSGTIR